MPLEVVKKLPLGGLDRRALAASLAANGKSTATERLAKQRTAIRPRQTGSPGDNSSARGGMGIVYAVVRVVVPTSPSLLAIEPYLIDLFWAHAVPTDELEHVSVQRAVDEVRAVFFVQAIDQMDAESKVDRFCTRLLRNTPVAQVIWIPV